MGGANIFDMGGNVSKSKIPTLEFEVVPFVAKTNTPPSPCIHIAFYLDGGLIPSTDLCGNPNNMQGETTINMSSLSLGHHTLSATYAGNTTYYPASLTSGFNAVS